MALKQTQFIKSSSRGRFALILVVCIAWVFKLDAQDPVGIHLIDRGWSGDTNLIDVRFSGFRNIAAFQFSFFDENRQGQLAGIELSALPNFGPSNYAFLPGFNSLSVSWDNPFPQGLTLPDGALAFRIHWRSDPSKAHCYGVSGAPVLMEFLNALFVPLPVVAQRTCDNLQAIPCYINAFHDANSNCAFDHGETLLTDFTVSDSFNGSLRHYKNPRALILGPSDEGLHFFRLSSVAPQWRVCNAVQSVQVDPSLRLISLDFPMQVEQSCPQLEATLSAPILRRCVEYEYLIHYRNAGTAPEPNALLRIVLDTFMEFRRASRLPSLIDGPVVEFSLGSLGIFQSGTLRLTVMLDCNRTITGQTHCLKAVMLPENTCSPSPFWNGAHLEVSASCSGDKARFRILNSGEQPMTEPSQFWIVEDDIMPGLKKNVLLDRGAFMDLEYPANGSTYRLFVDQVPFHPGKSNPTVVLEGCGRNQQGDFSRGYVLQFPEDEEDFHIATDCQESVGSHDPNQKNARPRGYSSRHFIEPGRAIEYRIDFQNEGTDTAWRVVIEDTLNDRFDLSSFLPTGASHFSTYRLIDRRLTVEFPGIRLPHRAASETASQGYFSYSVRPKSELPLQTVLRNVASIYFDSNPPVATNEQFHTLHKDFIVVRLDPADPEQHVMNIYPNPNDGSFQIACEDLKRDGMLSVYDAFGNPCFRLPWTGPALQVDLKGILKTGIYFLRISDAQGRAATTKILVTPSN
ncbi:MAG: T9SS type A sorting domain-containing protein [Saprospiraceae bacterium]|nr:T9SS type A sorting domain-containing protein [Saprospiraceae bacterium]